MVVVVVEYNRTVVVAVVVEYNRIVVVAVVEYNGIVVAVVVVVVFDFILTLHSAVKEVTLAGPVPTVKNPLAEKTV